MRMFAVAVVAFALSGCTLPTVLNSKTTDHSCSEMKKCCGCAGMENCQKNSDGSTCCKPDDCKCNAITDAR